MQHYGAPTRLMDWTYSPYVAAYFAFAELLAHCGQRPRGEFNSSERPAEAGIWAINTDDLWLAMQKRLSPEQYAQVRNKRQDPSSFKSVLTASGCPFITTATPLALNQRLSVQQGVFLCPRDITKSWTENLEGPGWTTSDRNARHFALRFSFEEAFERLRHMNIDARSLMPGLDGYGKFVLHRAKHLFDIPLFEEEDVL